MARATGGIGGGGVKGPRAKSEGQRAEVGVRSTRAALTIGSVIVNRESEIENLLARVARLERLVESHLGCQRGLDKEARRAAEIVGRRMKVTVEAILGQCKLRHIVAARHATWYLLAEHSAATPNHLAVMWNVHHGSILYALKSVPERMGMEKKFAEAIITVVDEFTRSNKEAA
jgi:chromosomal replication initiation ATPase DnaA